MEKYRLRQLIVQLLFGGIVGQITSTDKIIKDCKNRTAIEAKDAYYVGGIVGNVYIKTKIENCTNENKIEGKTNIGGIVGGGKGEIKDCFNKGEICGKTYYAGGICGISYNSIENCSNSGNITCDSGTGGIVGRSEYSSIVSECANSAKVNGGGWNTGGIVGITGWKDDGTTDVIVKKCYNAGEIMGGDQVGGIVGMFKASDGFGTVIQCYNKGRIIGTGASVGGLIGREYILRNANTINRLFYLKDIQEIKAIGGKLDDEETNKIMGIEDDLSYEEFKTWIEDQEL